MRHYLPGIQKASNHLSALEERYPSNADTEILKALIGLHSELSRRVKYEPHSTTSIFHEKLVAQGKLDWY